MGYSCLAPAALLSLFILHEADARAQESLKNEEPNSLLERSALLDGPGSPKEALRQHGINLDLWWTQFYQGLIAGDGDKNWQYGGKADVIATIDAHKLGLWSGLSATLHQEIVYGDDANTQGDGTSIPGNTAIAFPRIGGSDYDTSIVLSQQFGQRFTLSLGKFNMLDAASRTPLLGGGGVDTFSNTALAAPISGVTPPYLLGSLLTLRTEPATFAFFVYDPRNAQDSDVIEDPFADGVTFSLSGTIPVMISGLRGFQSLRGVYSTQEGIDLRDVPQLELPPELRDEPRTKQPYWYFSYSFQQFFYQSKIDPSKGWGLFGEFGISDGNPNPLSGHLFVGLGGNSFVPDRGDDRWGIAYFNYRLSSDLRDAARRDLGFGLGDEEGVEAYYNLAVTPWLRVTGDLQIINPFPSNKDEAVFAGIRVQTKF